MADEVLLRDVIDADLAIFYANQLDPVANAMVGLPPRDRPSFDAHWLKIRSEPSTSIQTIVHRGAVAGNILSFEREGKREVGYWLGRDFWGRGVATCALRRFLEHDRLRPLDGVVLASHAASARVLEKCGFARAGDTVEPAVSGTGTVTLWIYRLDA